MKKISLIFILCLFATSVYGAAIYRYLNTGESGTLAPNVINIQVSSITTTGATVTWTTDITSTNNKVYVDTSAPASTQHGSTDTNDTAHSVTFSDLTQNTLYYYHVCSEANGQTSCSPDATFSTAGTPPALVGEWLFDVGGGSAVDTSGNSYTATLSNTSYTTQAVCTGNGVVANGSNSSISVTGTKLQSNPVFCVSAFVNATLSGTYPRIVSSEGASNAGAYEIDINVSTGQLEMTVWNSNQQSFQAISSNGSIVTNTPYIIIGCFDGTGSGDKKPHLYINGTQVSYTGTGAKQETLTGSYPGTANTIYWGIRYDGLRAFTGHLDNLRVYNYYINGTTISTLAAECYPPFFPPVGIQNMTPSTPFGHCGGSTGSHPMDVGLTAAYVAFFDSSNTPNPCGAGGTHYHYVKKYNYTTGAWTTSSSVGSTSSGYDNHDAPSIFRHPSLGRLILVYGGIAAGVHYGNPCTTPYSGPFYNVSTNADDITAWESQQRVPVCGDFSDEDGGFTNNGTLFLMGQGQWASTLADSFQLVFMTATMSGTTLTWSTPTVNGMICDPKGYLKCDGTGAAGPGQSGGNNFGPGCMHNAYVIPGTDTIYLVWSSTTNHCSGGGVGVNFAKSYDAGSHWCSVAGTSGNCASSATYRFTYAAGLRANTSYGNYTGYQVDNSTITGRMSVRALSNGNPVIVDRVNTYLNLWKWSGSAWGRTTVDNSSGVSDSVMLEVLSDTHFLVFAIGGYTSLTKYDSTDAGATWTKTVLFTSPSASIGLYDLYFTPANQSPRVLLNWWDNSLTSTPKYQVGRFLDYPVTP